jgi:hypothetical protein
MARIEMRWSDEEKWRLYADNIAPDRVAETLLALTEQAAAETRYFEHSFTAVFRSVPDGA